MFVCCYRIMWNNWGGGLAHKLSPRCHVVTPLMHWVWKTRSSIDKKHCYVLLADSLWYFERLCMSKLMCNVRDLQIKSFSVYLGAFDLFTEPHFVYVLLQSVEIKLTQMPMESLGNSVLLWSSRNVLWTKTLSKCLGELVLQGIDSFSYLGLCCSSIYVPLIIK